MKHFLTFKKSVGWRLYSMMSLIPFLYYFYTKVVILFELHKEINIFNTRKKLCLSSQTDRVEKNV